MKCMFEEFNALSFEMSREEYFANYSSKQNGDESQNDEAIGDTTHENDVKVGYEEEELPLDEYVDDGVSLGYDLPHRGPKLENEKIEQPEENQKNAAMISMTLLKARMT